MAKPYKEVISESKMELEISLDELFGTKVPNDQALREAIGQSVIDTIVNRTQSNKALNGKPFKEYSDEYKKSNQFDVYGKSDEVTLTLTGDMLGTLDIKAQSRGVIKIGWDDDTQNAKAYNHHTGDTVKRRPFFGLTNDELSNIKKEFKDQVEAESPIRTQRLGDLVQGLTRLNQITKEEV
jgi:hypothetical protein